MLENEDYKDRYMCIISDLEKLLVFLKVISGHLGWVRCIAVEPGNQWFVTGSADRTIKVRAWKKSLTKFTWDVWGFGFFFYSL